MQVDLDASFFVVNAIDNASVEQELHALLLESVLERFANFSIEEGANALRVLHHSDLCAQTAVDGAHLEADHTTSNDNHLLGDLLHSKSTGGADDVLLVGLEARALGEGVGLGASSNDDVLGTDLLGTSGDEIDFDVVGSGELAPALGVGDAVLFEQVFDTSSKAVDSLGLALLQLVEVASDRPSDNTHILEVMLSSVQVVGSVQKSLGRNAADVEASTSEGASLLDANGLETLLSSLNGGDVAAGTTADDGDVVLCASETHLGELVQSSGAG